MGGIDLNKCFEGLGIQTAPSPISFYTDKDKIIYSLGYSAFIGDLLVEFVNLAKEKDERLIPLILKISDNTKRAKTSDNILTITQNTARQYVSPVMTHILMYALYDCLNTKSAIITFVDKVNAMINICHSYLKGGRMKPASDLGMRIEANLKVDADGIIKMEYLSNAADTILGFHILKMQEMGIRPQKCQMCGKWFYPASRSDEIYCRNEYKNGRTCAEMAFEVKSKADPFYDAYRKAYKTLSARGARMETKEAGRARLEHWRKAAKEKRDEYKSKGDLAGFLDWIEESKNTW